MLPLVTSSLLELLITAKTVCNKQQAGWSRATIQFTGNTLVQSTGHTLALVQSTGHTTVLSTPTVHTLTLVQSTDHTTVLSPPTVHTPPSTFLIEGVLGSKNLFSKSWRERSQTYG